MIRAKKGPRPRTARSSGKGQRPWQESAADDSDSDSVGGRRSDGDRSHSEHLESGLPRGAGSAFVPERPPGGAALPHKCRPGSPGRRDPGHLSRLRRRPPAREQRGHSPPGLLFDHAVRATLGRRRRPGRPEPRESPTGTATGTASAADDHDRDRDRSHSEHLERGLPRGAGSAFVPERPPGGAALPAQMPTGLPRGARCGQLLPATRQAAGVPSAWSQPFNRPPTRPRRWCDAGPLGRHASQRPRRPAMRNPITADRFRERASDEILPSRSPRVPPQTMFGPEARRVPRAVRPSQNRFETARPFEAKTAYAHAPDPAFISRHEDEARQEHAENLAPSGCRVRHCAGSTSRHRDALAHNVGPGSLGERDAVSFSRLRGRPPACHRRGRSPLNQPTSDHADGATLGRWDAMRHGGSPEGRGRGHRPEPQPAVHNTQRPRTLSETPNQFINTPTGRLHRPADARPPGISIRDRGRPLHAENRAPSGCRVRHCAGSASRLRGAPRTMSNRAPSGSAMRSAAPGYEAGRRRAIGVVAALSINPRATTSMVRRWVAGTPMRPGGPEGRRTRAVPSGDRNRRSTKPKRPALSRKRPTDFNDPDGQAGSPPPQCPPTLIWIRTEAASTRKTAPHRGAGFDIVPDRPSRLRVAPRTMSLPGSLGERDAVCCSRLRGRPPACHRRGRSPRNQPTSDHADGATLGRWDANASRRPRRPAMRTPRPFRSARQPDASPRCPPNSRPARARHAQADFNDL